MITIRKAKQDEWAIIASFQQAMALETEKIQLDLSTLEQGIKAVFKDTSKGCYYVAASDQQIIGTLMITYEWSDWRNRTVYWIQSVYVHPNHRRKGVYRQLYAYIQTLAAENDTIGGVRLYVDKTNQNAIKTYESLGMNGEHYQLFEWMKSF